MPGAAAVRGLPVPGRGCGDRIGASRGGPFPPRAPGRAGGDVGSGRTCGCCPPTVSRAATVSLTAATNGPAARPAREERRDSPRSAGPSWLPVPPGGERGRRAAAMGWAPPRLLWASHSTEKGPFSISPDSAGAARSLKPPRLRGQTFKAPSATWFEKAAKHQMRPRTKDPIERRFNLPFQVIVTSA